MGRGVLGSPRGSTLSLWVCVPPPPPAHPQLYPHPRSVLDFDFEKLCSISLSHINVYACLVCGKYFQGEPPPGTGMLLGGTRGVPGDWGAIGG